jgi:hypothetical protein
VKQTLPNSSSSFFIVSRLFPPREFTHYFRGNFLLAVNNTFGLVISLRASLSVLVFSSSLLPTDVLWTEKGEVPGRLLCLRWSGRLIQNLIIDSYPSTIFATINKVKQ